MCLLWPRVCKWNGQQITGPPGHPGTSLFGARLCRVHLHGFSSPSSLIWNLEFFFWLTMRMQACTRGVCVLWCATDQSGCSTGFISSPVELKAASREEISSVEGLCVIALLKESVWILGESSGPSIRPQWTGRTPTGESGATLLEWFSQSAPQLHNTSANEFTLVFIQQTECIDTKSSWWDDDESN